MRGRTTGQTRAAASADDVNTQHEEPIMEGPNHADVVGAWESPRLSSSHGHRNDFRMSHRPNGVRPLLLEEAATTEKTIWRFSLGGRKGR